ncbi:MAG: triose-phosphate isomerase [Chloroflexia bacterium]|nr:triose-phosphate isomerase [Chloroflexia bacterium]
MSSSTMPYVIGNWKMNLDVESAMSLAEASAEIANETADDVGVGIAIPSLWIPLISSEFFETSLLVGAQDCSPHAAGAYTGDVSAPMLSPWCAFTLVGHSERRQHHGEDDDLVRAKLDAVIEHDMAALLCVGETEAQREAGNALDVVGEQVLRAAGHLDSGGLRNLLVAYEPVWAIGTGQTATPADAQAMAAHIRGLIAGLDAGSAPEVPILYGGSVKAANAPDFFSEGDIDGALVGGASLDADDFLEIVRAARQTGAGLLADDAR